MKIYDLDNNLIVWKPKSKSSGRAGSKLHQRARELLTNLFPTVHAMEEVEIPVRAKQTLYLDFYIPVLSTALEIQGEQHFKFITHFHKTRMNFAKAKKRDMDKATWCEKNNILLIHLPYDENDEEWGERIQ